jgi:murein DD-endopeptidase MepM/ murein hydrolase activator NlpD
MWQVLSHHWDDQGGNHLAEDISISGGEDAVDAPVYSVADGVVLFAKKNASSYKNVVLIRHEIEGEEPVCSFYAHVHELKVSAGDFVQRGQQIAQVIDWADALTGGASRNTHLHYVFLSASYCRAVERTGTEDFSGSGVCGYDEGEAHDLGWTDLDNAPATYTAVEDDCGAWRHEGGLIAPSQFIEAHR